MREGGEPGIVCWVELHVNSSDNGVGDDVRGSISGPISGTVLPTELQVTHTETDSPFLHLQYRALVVEQKILPVAAESNAALGTNVGIEAIIDPTNNFTDKTIVCWSKMPTDPKCGIYNDPNSHVNKGPSIPASNPLCEVNQTLAPGQKCHFWVKARPYETGGLGSSEGSVGVTYNSNPEGTFTIHYSQDLYAAGLFYTAGGKPAGRIARWDGSDWYALDDYPDIAISNPLIPLTTFNGDLYMGVAFNISCFLRWNGDNWSSPVVGTVNIVNSFTTFDGALYAGGGFGVGIDRWNGSDLFHFGTGMSVFALTSFNDALYVGGFFTQAGGVANTKNIAMWNGDNWFPLGTGVNGVNVYALTSFNDALYVGGDFSAAGGVTNTNKIAMWDGSNWFSLGTGVSGSGSVNALTALNDALYVGGVFSVAGGVADTNNIAEWDPSTDSWSPLSEGLNGLVQALTSFNGKLYAGGSFTAIVGEAADSAKNIAEWDPSTDSWSSLPVGGDHGNGTGGTVDSLMVSPSLMLEPAAP